MPWSSSQAVSDRGRDVPAAARGCHVRRHRLGQTQVRSPVLLGACGARPGFEVVCVPACSARFLCGTRSALEVKQRWLSRGTPEVKRQLIAAQVIQCWSNIVDNVAQLHASFTVQEAAQAVFLWCGAALRIVGAARTQVHCACVCLPRRDRVEPRSCRNHLGLVDQRVASQFELVVSGTDAFRRDKPCVVCGWVQVWHWLWFWLWLRLGLGLGCRWRQGGRQRRRQSNQPDGRVRRHGRHDEPGL